MMELMNILLLYSAERTGDSLADELAAKLPNAARESSHPVEITTCNTDVPEELDKLEPDTHRPDLVVVLESLDAYISHRLRIGGRPWVVIVSFTFDDVYTLFNSTIPSTETGIDAYISNSQVFLRNMSTLTPSRFFWRPVPELELGKKGTRIGTVIDNVFDRDFSLVDYALTVLEAHGKKDMAAVYVHPRVDVDRLPGRLPKYARVYEDPSVPWTDLLYYLPAPRITDMRGGVVPPELPKALAYNCNPFSMAHSALDTHTLFMPQIGRLDELEWKLLDAVQGTYAVDRNPEAKCTPEVKELCELIVLQYERGKANAS